MSCGLHGARQHEVAVRACMPDGDVQRHNSPKFYTTQANILTINYLTLVISADLPQGGQRTGALPPRRLLVPADDAMPTADSRRLVALHTQYRRNLL